MNKIREKDYKIVTCALHRDFSVFIWTTSHCFCPKGAKEENKIVAAQKIIDNKK